VKVSMKIKGGRMKPIEKKKQKMETKKKYEKPEIKKHHSVSVISASCSYYHSSYSFGIYYV
jgi:hypothetical protein